MYKTMNINKKDYRVEFTIEASLYEECTEKLLGLMAKIGVTDDVEGTLKTMAGIPNTALTLFYAGLLEYHSDEIKSKEDAKALIKQWFAETPEGESRDFNVLLTLMIEQMGEDGFFKTSGLETLLTNLNQDLSAQKNSAIKPVKRTSKTAKVSKN